MIQTAEELIEIIRALPASEKEKVFDLLEKAKRELLEEDKREILSEKEAENIKPENKDEGFDKSES